jgi:hypothetical protein
MQGVLGISSRLVVIILTMAFCSAMFSAPGFSISLGIAPSVTDLGDVSAGSKYIVDFYIITDYDSDMSASLKATQIGSEFLDPARFRGSYRFVPSFASEEDITGWLRYIENPVVIKPEKMTYSLKDGSYVIANKRATIILDIPTDAEPGYHAAYVEPVPGVSIYGKGLGTTLIAVARMILVFNVDGNPARSGAIKSFGSQRIDYATEQVKIMFENTGTQTLIAKGSGINVYRSGELVGTLTTNFRSVRPGETAELDANWNVVDVEPGQYGIRATVSWTTGEAYREGVVDVHPAPARPLPVGEIVKIPSGFPYWIVIAVVIVIGVIIYRRRR